MSELASPYITAATVDRETLRFSLERDVLARLDALLRPSYVRTDRFDIDLLRRDLLANAIRLSESMAPELYAHARKAAHLLGVQDGIEIYQADGRENAAVHLLATPVVLEAQGRLVALLDEGSALALFGHELGHFLMHGAGSPDSLRALPLLSLLHTSGAPEAVLSDLRALSMARELTADRFGLLACRDLAAFLRLQMICTTGLHASSLTWDTQAYLAQCQDLISKMLEAGDIARGTTHPEHSVRTYAAWLFSETTEYYALTGLGANKRSLKEVDEILSRILRVPFETAAETVYEAIPREVHQCALAAAVLVATADGDFAERELEAIEKAFSGLVPDWRKYLEAEPARELFFETAIVVTALGEGPLRAVFSVLAHVMLADEEVTREEVQIILAVADVLQARELFTDLLISTLRCVQSPIIPGEVQAASIPLPVSGREAKEALDVFLVNASHRGTKVTARRLLRLAGHRVSNAEVVRVIEQRVARAGLAVTPALSFEDLDAPILLTPRNTNNQAARPSRVLSADRLALKKGITALRDELVSGDGRSPSVRLREPRPGRVVDLYALEGISTGLTERVLTQLLAGKAVRLFDAALEAKMPEASKLASALISLQREHKSRLEETGADDLYMGYPLLAGAIGGYVFRGPLLLYPVKLELEHRGVRAYALAPHDDTPVVNQSLLRLVYNRRKQPLPDSLLERLDEVAAEPGNPVEAIIEELRKAGLEAARTTADLGPLADDLDSLADAKNILRLNEVAALGLFPQSNSALLQEYDTILSGLDDASRDLHSLLGAGALLLPEALRPRIPLPSQVSEPLRPAIFADPSQREVVLYARQAPALVVDGPPGTGKSQVIANLITDAIARGERVAVVCEKRAALDVVVQRLDQLGLRPLLALVHDVHLDRRALFEQVAQRLERRSEVQHDEQELLAVERKLAETEEKLRRGTQHLRSRIQPSAPSLGELHTIHASFSVPALEDCPALTHLDSPSIHELAEAVTSACAYADVWSTSSAFGRASRKLGRASVARQQESDLKAYTDKITSLLDLTTQLEALGRGAPEITLVETARDALKGAQDANLTLAGPGVRTLFLKALTLQNAAPSLYADLTATAYALIPLAAPAGRCASPLRLQVPPRLTESIRIAERWATRFFRFLSPAWWRARSQIRLALPGLAPDLTDAATDTVTRVLSDRILAAEAWMKAEHALVLLGCPELLPGDGPRLAALCQDLRTAISVLESLSPYREALTRIHAWPTASFDTWQKSIESHLSRLGVLARHQANLTELKPLLLLLDAQSSALDLASMRDTLARHPARIAEADQGIESVATLLHGRTDRQARAETLKLMDAVGGSSTFATVVQQLFKTWASQLIDAAESRSSEVKSLPDAASHDAEIGLKLAGLDEQRGKLATARIWERCERSPILKDGNAAKHQRRSESQSAREEMLKEAKKQRRILPLRSFAQRFSDQGLLDVLPVWLLSPETVATLFPAKPLFDLIIFDEASQCTVANGLPVLSRAKRFVVAGDDKQMPPSNFFGAKGDVDDVLDDDKDKDLKTMFEEESLLTLSALRIERRSLSWHYRCQHESLIAFSNAAFYQGQLRSIPSPNGPAAPPAMRWVQVHDASYKEGVNEVEAERVVDTVSELLQRSEKPTVGVVTFNLKQRSTILDAIEARVSASAPFAEAWNAAASHPDLDQRPFVKNLEQVQGDERDVIVFSLGHAPAQRKLKSGGTEQYVPARFGPLGQRGGERRLNVSP